MMKKLIVVAAAALVAAGAQAASYKDGSYTGEGVESVGGATMSSDGIKAAVQDALAKAK